MSKWIKSSYCSGGDCVELAWQKSSFSSGGYCVETASHDGHVLMRDSKDPDGPRLRFTREEFAAFLAGAKAGEFDHLAEGAKDVAGGMFRAMVPTTVHVQTAPGDVEPIDHTVVMDLDVVDDRLVCTRIEVEMPDGGAPVTSEVLRRIPVGRYIREAAATGLLVLEVDRNDRSKAHPFVPPSRDFAEYGMSDEVLREVARLYHWALATGEAPLGLLEREYDIPRAKASRWISTARRRGYVKDAGPGRWFGTSGTPSGTSTG